MNFDSVVKSRKSVRRFSNKKPDWRAIIEAIDSARFAPTAGKNFTLKFIMVKDRETIQEIADAAEQSFIAKAHYLVAAYSDISRLTNLFGKRGEIYSRQQAGAAIQNFLLSIQDRGLATCWVGHFNDDKIKKILKIPDKMQMEAVFPVGYELGKSAKKPKIELDRILFFDQHKKKKMKVPYNPET
ncbi:MAG: nitroreductase family protein [Nanoarchaeota archaeon]|nr:nitroreductase family protein [Nanoarchaeota archaeon]